MNSCEVYARMKSSHWAFTLITSTSLTVPCSTPQRSPSTPLNATHGIQWRLAAIPLVFIILRIWDTVQNTTSIIASDYVNRGCTNVALQKGLFCLAILQVCNLYMHMPIDISFHCIFGAPVIATYKYYSRFHHSIYAIIMTTIVCCRQLEMEVKAGETVLSIFFFLVTWERNYSGTHSERSLSAGRKHKIQTTYTRFSLKALLFCMMGQQECPVLLKPIAPHEQSVIIQH